MEHIFSHNSWIFFVFDVIYRAHFVAQIKNDHELAYERSKGSHPRMSRDERLSTKIIQYDICN